VFVDASALLALILREPDAEPLGQKLDSASVRLTSPLALFETIVSLMRVWKVGRSAALDVVRSVLSEAEIRVIPITEEIGLRALDAFERFGKGRGHPARLNFGDCFAYACAKAEGVPLLYKGDDFKHTDITGAA
jgi:ribonuclease VapC